MKKRNEMVLIISNESDNTTNEVIRWLKILNKKYIRINEDDNIRICDIKISASGYNVVFCIDNKTPVSTENISSCWYRRGLLKYDDSMLKSVQLEYGKMEGHVKHTIMNDMKTLLSFLVYVIEKKNHVNSLNNCINNKLIHLLIAQSLNIPIPESEVITSKESLKNLPKAEHITKSISDGMHFMRGKKYYALYTHALDKNVSENAGEEFLPTLIQKKIEKKWELRIFYLRGKLYAMAIFSQNDSKTAVDFRRYNTTRPNYFVPYALPGTLKRQLRQFMNKSGLDSGSIDMIYGLDGKYYFLEVNPVGQFGMVSSPCNYYLEKKVASLL